MTEKPHVVKISDHVRIRRILSRGQDVPISLLIRKLHEPNIAVRASCRGTSSDGAWLILAGISERGMVFLEDGTEIQLEFNLPSLKLVAMVVIEQRDRAQGRVMTSLPGSLQSHERRSSTRHAVAVDYPVWVLGKDGYAPEPELLAPPCFPFLEEVAYALRVGDISQGGFCLVSPFLKAFESLEEGKIEEHRPICFPLRRPIAAKFVPQWFRSHPVDESPPGVRPKGTLHAFLVGCAFVEPSEELLSAVAKYAQQTLIRGAI